MEDNQKPKEEMPKENLSPEQMKAQIESLKSQLQIEKNNKQPVYIKSKDPINEQVIQEGLKVLKEFLKQKNANEKLAIQEETNYLKDKLQTVKELDKREKNFKGYILSVCLAILIVAAFYNILLGLAPIVSVIIGAILTQNAAGDFLSKIRRNSSDDFTED